LKQFKKLFFSQKKYEKLASDEKFTDNNLLFLIFTKLYSSSSALQVTDLFAEFI